MFKQRLEWKVKRILRQMEDQLDSFNNLWRGARSSTRMCSSCRALVGVDEKICSLCGARLGYRPSGIGKLIQNLVPHYAPVSFTLLTINFLFFLLIFYVDRDRTTLDIRQLLLGADSRTLAAWGANAAWLINQGQWWRLFSAIFIHIGMIHLAFNSYALIFIGPLLEELLGKERFLFIYLTTGAFGFVLSNAYYPARLTTAGASGAIFGMIGAAIVLSKRSAAWSSVMRQQLVHWAIYGFVYGLILGANAAHLGGFVSGVAIAWVLGNPNRWSVSESRQWLWKAIYWLSIGVAFISLGLAFRFRMMA